MTQAPDPNTDRSLDGEQPPGLPRWVKISALLAALLLVALLIALLVGGNHGPARHQGDAAGGRHEPALNARAPADAA